MADDIAQYTGMLVLLVGPSGSGKGTLLRYVKERYPRFIYPTSCTTRSPRVGETDGETYYFVSDEEFDRRITEGDFLEWAEYGGHRYGTLASEVVPHLKSGKIVIREMEVQGVAQILELFPPENVTVVYIYAGGWEELRARIKKRGPMSEEALARRRARFEEEIMWREKADFVIDNKYGNIEAAQRQVDEVLQTLTADIYD